MLSVLKKTERRRVVVHSSSAHNAHIVEVFDDSSVLKCPNLGHIGALEPPEGSFWPFLVNCPEGSTLLLPAHPSSCARPQPLCCIPGIPDLREYEAATAFILGENESVFFRASLLFSARWHVARRV
jgi:hypothetical protein